MLDKDPTLTMAQTFQRESGSLFGGGDMRSRIAADPFEIIDAGDAQEAAKPRIMRSGGGGGVGRDDGEDLFKDDESWKAYDDDGKGKTEGPEASAAKGPEARGTEQEEADKTKAKERAKKESDTPAQISVYEGIKEVYNGIISAIKERGLSYKGRFTFEGNRFTVTSFNSELLAEAGQDFSYNTMQDYPGFKARVDDNNVVKNDLPPQVDSLENSDSLLWEE